jgi:hypothetical protein
MIPPIACDGDGMNKIDNTATLAIIRSDFIAVLLASLPPAMLLRE